VEDGELVERARAGEDSAFEELMRRYERLVYRIVDGFARDREEALDLTQAVFLKAFRGLGGFRGEAGFKTWLLRIAHREGLNWSRAAGRRPGGVEIDGEAAALARPAEQEERLLERERRGALGRALAGLHGRYRTAIRLRYLDRMSIREIASVLDTSEAMTKNLLFRGVRSLRRAVEEAS